MATSTALKARAATAASRYNTSCGYADWYAQRGVTHELTISLGIHPKRFDPETEFMPQLKRIARRIGRDVRGLSKRQVADPSPNQLPWMAGFYEPNDGAGFLFPHWHGAIALQPGEEWRLRLCLSQYLGDEATVANGIFAPLCERTIISTPKAKPTFHLAALTEIRNYVHYARKQGSANDTIHWSLEDILAS
jgi:hypothetical protein